MRGGRLVGTVACPLTTRQLAQVLLAFEATFPGSYVDTDGKVYAPTTAGVAVIDLDADEDDDE